MGIIAGIDEAGRGPVLGPMVLAVCAIDESDTHKLVEMGVKDSKLLTPEKREELFPKVQKLCTWELAIVPPTEVDAAVNSKKDNLNHLEARTSADLLKRIMRRVRLSEATLDCPSTNTKKYHEQMQGLIDCDLKLIVEHKADMNYPVVAAASILAKVTRDREMKNVSKLAGADIGSGYMTDPKTHAWLQENYDKDFGFLRQSWASVKNLKSGKAQRHLFEFGDGKEEIAKFDKLLPFGFRHEEPKTQYELVRMKGPENVQVTIIKYSSGKLLVQGNEKEKMKANALLQSTGLL